MCVASLLLFFSYAILSCIALYVHLVYVILFCVYCLPYFILCSVCTGLICLFVIFIFLYYVILCSLRFDSIILYYRVCSCILFYVPLLYLSLIHFILCCFSFFHCISSPALLAEVIVFYFMLLCCYFIFYVTFTLFSFILCHCVCLSFMF